MKISIEEIEAAMLENKIDAIKVAAIIKQLEEVAEELKNDKDQTPKQKYEHIIILNDPDGYLAEKEISGWVVQQEKDADPALILPKLRDVVKAQNEVTKKKKNFITDLLSAFEYLKPKFVKEKKLKIKTRDLTRCIISNGKF